MLTRERAVDPWWRGNVGGTSANPSARTSWRRACTRPRSAQARAATEAIELALVEREHHFDGEELDLGRRVAHSASFRYVSSCASISRSAAASARSISGAFLAGRMMSASPSVLTLSGVSLVMSSSSRMGRSMMRPRLLSTAESSLTVVGIPHSHARKTPGITLRLKIASGRLVCPAGSYS